MEFKNRVKDYWFKALRTMVAGMHTQLGFLVYICYYVDQDKVLFTYKNEGLPFKSSSILMLYFRSAEGFLSRWRSNSGNKFVIKFLNVTFSKKNYPAMSHRLPDFYKYPRTPHLFNTGGNAVTVDDLVHDAHSNNLFFRPPSKLRLTVEEKIDGANLGIAVGSDYALTVQNRSHYVTAASHPQFKMLPTWLAEYGAELYQLLMEAEGEGEEPQPGGRILYGEWMVAQHSIFYTHLPGYFVAFDLYDTEKKQFFSRERFWTLMRRLAPRIPFVPVIEIPAPSKIPPTEITAEIKAEVDSLSATEPAATIQDLNTEPDTSISEPAEITALPTIAFPPLSTDAQLTTQTVTQLLQRKSAFAPDVTIEGVYLRLDEGLWLKHRAKIVRPDFIPGNEHWSKTTITKNRLRMYGEDEAV